MNPGRGGTRGIERLKYLVTTRSLLRKSQLPLYLRNLDPTLECPQPQTLAIAASIPVNRSYTIFLPFSYVMSRSPCGS